MTPLVEVTRGPVVESVHAGHIAVVDADGRPLLEVGEPQTPVFPRSAIKLIQALPLVASGAADAFGYGAAQLALACASHSGEPAHIETARSMLAKAGLDETCLACGGHWSLRQNALISQARRFDAKPGPICNNCSGKHAGMLARCRHEDWPVAGYHLPDHKLQRSIAAMLADLTGVAHGEANRAVDGCSIPTYAVPLASLARAFAAAFRSEPAAARLYRAATAEPFHTAGTARFCTDFMVAADGAAYAKTGAEGVYCGWLADPGIAIALKVADGAGRASEVAFANVANAFLDRPDLASFESQAVTDWNGLPVGQVRLVPAIRERLLAAAGRTG